MSDLFNNPMIQQARQALTPEQLEEYQQIGEAMYGNIDYVNSKVLESAGPPTPSGKALNECTPPEIIEAVAYITEAIKSGLHPDYLDDNEKELCKAYYGEDWLSKYSDQQM